jgi:hypothetical protein
LDIGCVVSRTFWASALKDNPSPFPVIASVTFGDNNNHPTLSSPRVETGAASAALFFVLRLLNENAGGKRR